MGVKRGSTNHNTPLSVLNKCLVYVLSFMTTLGGEGIMCEHVLYYLLNN